MKARTPVRSWRRIASCALVAAVALSVAACSGSTQSSAKGKGGSDPSAVVTVWTDVGRRAAFDDFQKANPNVKLKVEVIDATTILSKIQLANRVGSGWPDVIFSSSPSDIASLSAAPFNYAQQLDDLVPKSIQANFATHSAACTIGGKLYCLQNDLAQDVIWYNKPLMAQFGYQIPTTWAEYEALGDKVAQQHPGYLIGAVGAVNVYYDYLWSSGCPLQSVKDSTHVRINALDPKCTRMASLLDRLLKNGSVSRLSMFGPDLFKDKNKILMMPGSSWVGQYVLKPASSFGIPNGVITAAPMPSWPGEPTNYSGAQGGGIYVVSRHAKNLAGSVATAQWVATNNAYQATAATYPAYIPAAQAWLAGTKADPWYAADPSAVLTAAAGKINPAEGPTRYDMLGPVTSTIVAAITSGGTITGALGRLQSQLHGLAQAAGYSVSK